MTQPEPLDDESSGARIEASLCAERRLAKAAKKAEYFRGYKDGFACGEGEELAGLFFGLGVAFGVVLSILGMKLWLH